MRNDFAIFILSHGRADCVSTISPLLGKGNYSGKWYVLIDDQDDQEEYKNLYGDHVLVFDKEAAAAITDTGELGNERRSAVFARNHCFDLAKEMGLRYFLMLDDDYTKIIFRFQDGNQMGWKDITNIDDFFEAILEFYESSGALTVAIAQGGDYIGGINSDTYNKGLLRKAMNTFFCDVEKPFKFVGRMNSDVNTYVTLTQRGKLFFTITAAQVNQKPSQKTHGGVSEVYAEMGTYTKSFFSVMYAPSCVTVSSMGEVHKRVHHMVRWENCAPKILSERWKKS